MQNQNSEDLHFTSGSENTDSTGIINKPAIFLFEDIPSVNKPR
jgi:hypothetical protein